MRNSFVLAALMISGMVFTSNAQENATKSATPAAAPSAAPAVVISPTSTPTDLARAAFLAQGGDKFRSVQNMILRGSVQLYPPNSVQSIPGSFSIVTSGDKLRMEIDARPAIVFKQIFDGQNSYSSMPNVQLPPLTKFGLGALSRYDQPGYKVTTIADKKKQRGFRIEDPEGFTTDFYIDATNGRLMSFLIYYQGFTFGTENNKFKEIEGVLVPFSFSQRFEMPQGAFFAEYSVKEAKLNQSLAVDAFEIPN
ncbi:MAG TPA: hypothetical protein VGQ39_04010 [Pyrinomonadaceae bacterium]|jgi:hypothetical protein|nr:hypothetical protein [Pyrinomonadaceae bacterium]